MSVISTGSTGWWWWIRGPFRDPLPTGNVSGRGARDPFDCTTCGAHRRGVGPLVLWLGVIAPAPRARGGDVAAPRSAAAVPAPANPYSATQVTVYPVSLPGIGMPGSRTTQPPASPRSRATSSKWHMAMPMSMRCRSAMRSTVNSALPLP